MSIELEKIDTVIDRTGVSYKEAKEALEASNYDVVEAIIYLEEKLSSSGSFAESIESKGEKLLEKLKDLIKEGNVNKITIKKDGEILANIPINVGAVAFLATTFWSTVGLTAAVLTKHTIEITKKDGEVINLKEASERTINKVKSDLKKQKSGRNLK